MDSDRYQYENVDDRSIGSLLADLFRDGSTLIRQEVELAKAEISENLSRLMRDGIWLAIGAVIAFVGLLGLVASAILGLALVLPAWAAALIVGGTLALIGLVLVLGNLRAMRQTGIMPRQTIETLREDAQMVKEKFA